MPFVQVADVSDDMKLVDDTKQKISKLAQPMSVCAEEGSVLVTLQGSIGRVAIMQYKAFVDRTVLIFDKYNADIDKTFWAYIIKEKFIEEARKAPGGTIKTITKEVLSDFDLMLPSYDEQKMLGKLLHSLDHLITLHQREFAFLCKEKSKKFRYIKNAWEQRKLGEVGTTYTGLSGKTADDFGHGEASFITYMNVFSHPVANSEMVEHVEIDNKQREVQVGDVFFTTSSETPEEVGMSSVLKEKHGVTYLNSFCFGFRPNVKFDLDYLAYMLRSEPTRSQIKILAQGISRFNISKNKMMDINIQVPNLEEQAMVGAYFRNLDHLITLHQRELEKLKNLKKACLEKMFV